MDEIRLKELNKKRNTMIKTHFILIFFGIIFSFIIAIIYFVIMKKTKKSYFLFIEILFYIVPYLTIFIKSSKSERYQYIIGLSLSIIFCFSLSILLFSITKYYTLYLYFISLCIYHYTEYFSVLLFHPQKISAEYFLIDQSKKWVFCTLFSFAETIIETYFLDKYKKFFLFFYLGLLMTIIGQYFRIAALYTGKYNFTHRIETIKREKHKLITHGIYSLSRHPSYFGFFLWSVGIEVMCFNPICIIAFTITLFKFFKNRIITEEKLLIKFFGYDYLNYKKKVGILIPFIRLTKFEEELYLQKYKDNNFDWLSEEKKNK